MTLQEDLLLVVVKLSDNDCGPKGVYDGRPVLLKDQASIDTSVKAYTTVQRQSRVEGSYTRH